MDVSGGPASPKSETDLGVTFGENVQGFEKVILGDTSDKALNITMGDLIQDYSNGGVLTIDGTAKSVVDLGADSEVSLGGFTLADNAPDTPSGYNAYMFDNNGTDAYMYIAEDVQVI